MPYPQPFGPPTAPFVFFDPCDHMLTLTDSKSAGVAMALGGTGPQMTYHIIAAPFVGACQRQAPGFLYIAPYTTGRAGPLATRY